MVELDEEGRTIRAYAKVIPDIKSDTIIPFILENVKVGSVVMTDESRSYLKLSKYGYIHRTVCHKKEFVNHESNTHTQNVESFNNCIKWAIKYEKSVLTRFRQKFLNVVCFKFNNRRNILSALFNLIKH